MYYIYHIPGKKIGCTREYPKRCIDQGFKIYELLETHEDGWYAGDRELILQAEYGYPIDKSHYMISRQNRHKLDGSQRTHNLTKEERSRGGKAGKGIPKPKFKCPYCNKLIGGRFNLNKHVNVHKKRAL